MYDMQKVTKMAHDVGALVLWDLSHSVGSVPIHLNEAHVDMAIGCTYKYLNGGPGAPAFLYVRKDLQEKLLHPIQGWFGASNPFEFSLEYKAAADLTKFLTGTPPILSMSAIEAGVDMLLKAGMNNVRKKSVELSEFFLLCWRDHLKELGFELNSPKATDSKGSHLSLSHREAFRINKALMEPSIDGFKIVPDFRAPNNIRFGFAPLYCSFADVVRTIQKLEKIVTDKHYLNYNFDQSAVT
jgi:kynureninase